MTRIQRSLRSAYVELLVERLTYARPVVYLKLDIDIWIFFWAYHTRCTHIGADAALYFFANRERQRNSLQAASYIARDGGKFLWRENKSRLKYFVNALKDEKYLLFHKMITPMFHSYRRNLTS